MRDLFTVRVSAAAAAERLRGLADFDKADVLPDAADADPGPPVVCEAPCGWCTVEGPCEAMRRGVEASLARKATVGRVVS